ncbi:MAG: DUF4124 domain-containing protein [Pseudomonadales bacterium]|nr:DUF4124 domain-containing protein [Pseudomonadales bacterium]
MLRFLVLILLINVCQAEVYRWKDKNGKVHFSDSKPVSVESEVKNYDNPQPKTDLQLQESRRYNKQKNNQYQQQKFRDKIAASRKKALKQSRANARKELCYEAKKQMGILQKGVPVYVIDNNGDREFLANKDHKAEIKSYRKLIKKNC